LATFVTLNQPTIVCTGGPWATWYAVPGVENLQTNNPYVPNRRSDKDLSTSMRFCAFLCLMLTVPPATTGGSWERVLIDEIVINGLDYTLFVTPSDKTVRDPYFGRCRRFEVRLAGVQLL
jgi:hypothetical protein